MNKFRALTLGLLAVGGLAMAGCERRAPTADPQGKGYVDSKDPSTTAAPNTAPSAPGVPATSTDLDRQPVAGRDPTATDSDLYLVAADGTRSMVHDTVVLTQIQQRLATDGFYRGTNDGRTSPELAASIRQFQAKKGLAQTGTLDRQTADAMGLDWAKLSTPAGTTTGETIGVKADKAGAAVENKAGELRGKAKEGATKVGDSMDRTAAETGGATTLGNEVKAGAKDIGKDIDSGAVKMKDGTRDVTRDVGAGAKEAGREVKSGAKDVGREIEKSANEAGRKIDESVK